MKQFLQLLLLIGISVLLPALLISIGVFLFVGYFWGTLIFTFGLIYVIGLVSNKFTESKINTKINELNEYISRKTLEQSMEVSCAYCGMRHIIPIRVDERNTFECKKCSQTSLIVFQFTTAQLTTPLVVTDTSAGDIIKQKVTDATDEVDLTVGR